MSKRKDRKKRKAIKHIDKVVQIQASLPEGSKDSVIIESMLTGLKLNMSIPGTVNAFSTYESQVSETYKKYNGFSSFGNQQTRAIVDLRTAFIAGEGISISCEDEVTADWIEKFIQDNNFNGQSLINSIKGSEITGQSLFLLKEKDTFVKATRVIYNVNSPYKPVFNDNLTRDEVTGIMVKKELGWESTNYTNFIYIRTGGDDSNSQGPTTRVGIILTDIENYDRAIKDMRRNNHIFARITPVWQTATDPETSALKTKLEKTKWKIGQAFVGKAKFKYETPQTGAHENLSTELTATIKTISATSGVPVHWLGYVDLMSNRATAESLYELIKNATILERQTWEDSFYNIILKAQEMYINSGGKDITNLNQNFEVKLPLINFNEFLNRVKALNMAYMDEAISMDDYRNSLPGIDPLKTKRAIEKEQEEAKNDLIESGKDLPNIEEEGEE